MTNTEAVPLADGGLELNQFRAECEQCGTVHTSRINSFRKVTSAELADRQGAYCETCDGEKPHQLLEAGGDDAE